MSCNLDKVQGYPGCQGNLEIDTVFQYLLSLGQEWKQTPEQLSPVSLQAS